MIRHKSFGGKEELREFIVRTIPSDIYYSTAYYQNPELSMEKKIWMGADLCFDVDADHIETPCKLNHDVWRCSNCGTQGRGPNPPSCIVCQAAKISEGTWLCEMCLDAAKNEVFKLQDFLTADFGIKDTEIEVFFSGHRGYHLHVRHEDAIRLNDSERKEIVDYVSALGLDPYFHGLYREGPSGTKSLIGPAPSDLGWRGRLANIAASFAKGELVIEHPSLRKGIKQLKEGKMVIDERNRGSISWNVSGIGQETWKRVLLAGVDQLQLKANIDTVVTTDIHRLIRLPGTLNGKTGFKAVKVSLAELTDFDPFADAIAFHGSERIRAGNVPRFRIGDEIIEPSENERLEVPTAAAVLLISKGLAEHVDTG